MNGCAEWREALVEVGRGGVHPAASAHARACPRCAGELREALELSAGLRALADADGSHQAPAWMEEQLRARYARAFPAGGRRRRLRALPAAVLAVAALVLAVALLLRPAPPAAPLPAEASTAETEFLPLVYGEPLDGADAVHLTRVRVPRRALASFGWQMEPEDGPPVEAEVLVGNDGVARGIRLVGARGDVP